ncbi:MAG TPA: carboxymuconolactone decarboxylase family protein [Tepidisphaeraceae bacterium]|nr:carboxymuconolactone decarboxylase family protein [Tepidisphaeraceae bacterium]
MKPRIQWHEVAPEAYKAQATVEQYVRNCGLEKPLLELVKLRASQINQCAFCIDMHWNDARAAGETEQRLYGLSAWRESPYYTDRERAALEWTEAVTVLTNGFVPDAAYDAARSHFNEKELVNLTMAIVAINGWNRLSVSFRSEPGKYQPRKR